MHCSSAPLGVYRLERIVLSAPLGVDCLECIARAVVLGAHTPERTARRAVVYHLGFGSSSWTLKVTQFQATQRSRWQRHVYFFFGTTRRVDCGACQDRGAECTQQRMFGHPGLFRRDDRTVAAPQVVERSRGCRGFLRQEALAVMCVRTALRASQRPFHCHRIVGQRHVCTKTAQLVSIPTC